MQNSKFQAARAGSLQGGVEVKFDLGLNGQYSERR